MNGFAVVLVLVLALLLLRPSSRAAVAPDGLQLAAPPPPAPPEASDDFAAFHAYVVASTGSAPVPLPHKYTGIGGGGIPPASDPGPLHEAFGTTLGGSSGAWYDPAVLGYNPGDYDPAAVALCDRWRIEHPGHPCSEIPSHDGGAFARIFEQLDMQFLGAVSYGVAPKLIAGARQASAQPTMQGSHPGSAVPYGQ